MSDERGLRNISDTARWVAIYRALESERPDALFHDPFARRLAGERGARITEGKAFANRNAWSFVARTVVFDRFISDAVANGADMVVNLAAGLDARPYRMTLPSQLQWIEVDLPELLAYKTEQLAHETPRCHLERVALDLSNVAARRELFARLSARAKAAMVVSEGLVVYLASEEAGALAFKFAPDEGPAFFERCGWTPVDVQSMLHNAARLKRLSWWMRMIALLPDSKGRQPRSPWGGVCLFEKVRASPAS